MSITAMVQVNPEQFKTEIIEDVKVLGKELLKRLKSIVPEEYLTREEVARLLKVSVSTVSNWKNEGVINAYGLGGRVYYKRSELEKAMIKIN